MTWRRFLVLLGGLSADSRWVGAVAEQRAKEAKRMKFSSQADLEAFAASGFGTA